MILSTIYLVLTNHYQLFAKTIFHYFLSCIRIKPAMHGYLPIAVGIMYNTVNRPFYVALSFIYGKVFIYHCRVSLHWLQNTGLNKWTPWCSRKFEMNFHDILFGRGILLALQSVHEGQVEKTTLFQTKNNFHFDIRGYVSIHLQNVNDEMIFHRLSFHCCRIDGIWQKEISTLLTWPRQIQCYVA